jgi:hypothetical protein
MLNVDRRIEISVRAVVTDLTAKRLLVGLVGAVGAVHIIAHTKNLASYSFGCSEHLLLLFSNDRMSMNMFRREILLMAPVAQ